MTARVTTGSHFHPGRSLTRTIADAPLVGNTASIIAVEPNRKTRNTFPVEARQHVIFSVSLGTDGIWRIERFNSTFVEIFSTPHPTSNDGAQYTLPLAFATKFAGALRRCAENGRPVGLDMSVQIEGRIRQWEFLLESAHGPDALPQHILVHGHDVTSQHETLRRLRRITGKLLSSQDDERRRIGRDLRASPAQHLVALGIGVAHLEALAKRQDNLAGSISRKVIANMRTNSPGSRRGDLLDRR